MVNQLRIGVSLHGWPQSLKYFFEFSASPFFDDLIRKKYMLKLLKPDCLPWLLRFSLIDLKNIFSLVLLWLNLLVQVLIHVTRNTQLLFEFLLYLFLNPCRNSNWWRRFKHTFPVYLVNLFVFFVHLLFNYLISKLMILNLNLTWHAQFGELGVTATILDFLLKRNLAGATHANLSERYLRKRKSSKSRISCEWWT